ncbi:MAG TPA: SLC13 family permease [Methylomirabilota bacterium]|nr:SLC13 family permease [Methylomirabilota bacterium]
MKLLLAAAIAPVVAHLWATSESRGAILLVAAALCWTLDVVPDHVVALGVIVVWNVAALGPSGPSISGFASPVWFLLLGVLAVGGCLARSGLLQRIAFALLSLFPATFTGQVVAFLVGGLVTTPLLPLNAARCALTAPLARQVAETLGYPPRSRAAVGLGLAAFTGSGLLSRVFLSGAPLNLVAWSLLPPPTRPGWWMWALAAAPTMLVMTSGALAIILLTCRPADDRPIAPDVIQRLRRDIGPLGGEAYLSGAAASVMLIGLVAGPFLDIDGAWFACLAAMALAATGVLTSEQIRSTIDWPFLIFLGVILSMPAMVHHIGVDAELAQALPPVVAWSRGSPAPTLALLFTVATATRIVLSEWVAVPLLTGVLVPIAPTLGLDPWVLAFVVLSASNLWTVPYQLAAYRTFCSASDGYLFTHGQARAFSVAYLLLCLCGLLASIPLWRWLGLLS